MKALEHLIMYLDELVPYFVQRFVLVKSNAKWDLCEIRMDARRYLHGHYVIEPKQTWWD